MSDICANVIFWRKIYIKKQNKQKSTTLTPKFSNIAMKPCILSRSDYYAQETHYTIEFGVNIHACDLG